MNSTQRRKDAKTPDQALSEIYRPQDLDSLRLTYEIYRGKDMGANAVLNLCDEVEILRCALGAFGRHVFPCAFDLRKKQTKCTCGFAKFTGALA